MMEPQTITLKRIEKDKVRRIGTQFNAELESIKKALKKKGIHASNGTITNLILKHDCWAEIKEDLINYEFAKE